MGIGSVPRARAQGQGERTANGLDGHGGSWVIAGTTDFVCRPVDNNGKPAKLCHGAVIADEAANFIVFVSVRHHE